MKKLALVTAIAFAGLSSACTWVKVSEHGSRIAVANASHVQSCNKVRTVNVKVKDNYVGSMKRNPEKVAVELANLARNEASQFGGDTIVPVSQPNDGRQSFDVYRCQ